MKPVIQGLALCAIASLSACTATNKYKGPNFTFDDQIHHTKIEMEKPIPTEIKKEPYPSAEAPAVHANASLPAIEMRKTAEAYLLRKSCSQAHSVHSPIIWLPVIGPAIDLLLVPSVAELSWADAWSIIPLAGPPISYVKGAKDCIYFSLDIFRKDDADGAEEINESRPPLESYVSEDAIRESIATSDRNCSAYQHIMEAGFNELDANQKFLSDAATVTQTGAAFANPVAAAVIGGLKQTVTSANDAIKTSFFAKLGLPEIFENIAAVRRVLVNELTESTNHDDGSVVGGSNSSSWGYRRGVGMHYGNLRRFMAVYDKSCLFEQALSDLRLTTDKGQSDLKEPDVAPEQSGAAPTEPSPPKAPAQAGTNTGKRPGGQLAPAPVTEARGNIKRQILINNNANPL